MDRQISILGTQFLSISDDNVDELWMIKFDWPSKQLFK